MFDDSFSLKNWDQNCLKAVFDVKNGIKIV